MACKSFPAKRKLQKAFHATLHLIALLAGVVGVYTAFKFKYEVGDKDMASLHSWLGMITICLFGLQVCLFGLQVILFFPCEYKMYRLLFSTISDRLVQLTAPASFFLLIF